MKTQTVYRTPMWAWLMLAAVVAGWGVTFSELGAMKDQIGMLGMRSDGASMQVERLQHEIDCHLGHHEWLNSERYMWQGSPCGCDRIRVESKCICRYCGKEKP